RRVDADLLDLDAHVAGATVVLTGEGAVDAQTLAGKAPAGVVAAARRHHVPVIIFGGRVEPEAEALLANGAVEALVAVSTRGAAARRGAGRGRAEPPLCRGVLPLPAGRRRLGLGRPGRIRCHGHSLIR
ncbi:glycerate kinase, partial [Propioniciclava flava]